MPDAVRIHLIPRGAVVLREHHSSRVRAHDGTTQGRYAAIDALLAELEVDWDVEAPVSQGQAHIGLAKIVAGRVVELRRT